jgi:WD40 repeat protein
MVWEVAYTPDGTRLVTASSDGSVRFWDARTGAMRGSFDWQAGKVRCVAVSPDGLTVASGGQDGRIVIADVEP